MASDGCVTKYVWQGGKALKEKMEEKMSKLYIWIMRLPQRQHRKLWRQCFRILQSITEIHPAFMSFAGKAKK